MSLEEVVARQGRPYGFMEPAVPELPVARRYTAVDVLCASCGAEIGVLCQGSRVCQMRVNEALELVRSGQLAEAPEPVKTADSTGCDDCGKERTQRGRPVACSPAHRCQRILTTRKRCAVAVEAGSRWCLGHTQPKQRRWN